MAGDVDMVQAPLEDELMEDTVPFRLGKRRADDADMIEAGELRSMVMAYEDMDSHDLDREILNRTPDNQPPPLQPGDMQVPEYMDDGDARVAGRSDLQDQEFAFPTKGVYKTIPPQISPARKEVAMMFSSIDRHTNADMPIDMTLSTYQAMHDRYHQVVQRVQSMRLFDDPMAAEAAIELNKQLNDECVFIRQMEDPLTQRTMFLYACDEKRAPCLSLSMSAHGLEAFQWIEPRKRVVSHFHKRSNDNDLC